MDFILPLILIIVALLGYITYLQIQLTKKNHFIATTVERLSHIDSSRSMEEMVAFLEELHKIALYSSYVNDKFPDKNATDFLLEKEKELKIYMHYTKEENDALNIMKTGFLFVDSFYRTALPVTSDRLDFKIKHNSRRYFGDYLVVICISEKIVSRYSSELKKKAGINFTFENILTEKPTVKNENGDIIYLLPPQFIKGYINHRTGAIVKNQSFNPAYESPAFEANIESFMNA
jgi:hypothetical protein